MSGLLRIIAVATLLFSCAFYATDARAVDIPPCAVNAAQPCDQGQAYSAAEAWGTSARYCTSVGVWTHVRTEVRPNGTNRYEPVVFCNRRQDNYTTNFIRGDTAYFNRSCSTRSEQTGWKTPDGTSGGKVCNEGCAYDAVVDATAPNGLVFQASGSTCRKDEHPEPQPATGGGDDGGGGSGETGGGDGGGDNGGGDGGTNPGGGDNGGGGSDGGGDGDGEGEGGDGEEGGGTGPGTGPGTGDQEGDGQASGGEGCDAPPTCSGDPIACNTNWQIWRMRCDGTATGKVEGDVNDCSKPLKITSPDQLANAQLLLQRKIACKDGDQPSWTKVTGDGNDAGTDPKPEDFVKEVNLNLTNSLDESGFLGSGACPQIGSFSIPALGYTFDGSKFTYFCDLMKFLRGLVIIFFGILPAGFILLSRSI